MVTWIAGNGKIKFRSRGQTFGGFVVVAVAFLILFKNFMDRHTDPKGPPDLARPGDTVSVTWKISREMLFKLR